MINITPRLDLLEDLMIEYRFKEKKVKLIKIVTGYIDEYTIKVNGMINEQDMYDYIKGRLQEREKIKKEYPHYFEV